jgi:hypothetical protein
MRSHGRIDMIDAAVSYRHHHRHPTSTTSTSLLFCVICCICCKKLKYIGQIIFWIKFRTDSCYQIFQSSCNEIMMNGAKLYNFKHIEYHNALISMLVYVRIIMSKRDFLLSLDLISEMLLR